MHRARSQFASSALLALAVAGSAAFGAPDTPAKKTPTPPPAPDALAKPLSERISGKQELGDVELDLLWGKQNARVYGAGVGICDHTYQIPVSRAEVVALLEAVKAARFGAMPDRFGGEEEEEEKERHGGDIPQMLGRLEVRLGPVSKTVAQMQGGDQSKELGTLATRILKTCDGAPKRGVGAASLADGLSKLASGKLSPQAFEALVQRRERRSGPSDAPENWILRLEGQDAVGRRMPGGRTPDAPKKLILSDKEFQNLVALLSTNDVGALPTSVYSAEYTDLRVRVLNRQRVVSGRRFGGAKTEGAGAPHPTFDRIYDGMHQLYLEIQREGKVGTEPVELRSERESEGEREKEEERERAREKEKRERPKPVTTPSPGGR
jgi:hypothetical protein